MCKQVLPGIVLIAAGVVWMAQSGRFDERAGLAQGVAGKAALPVHLVEIVSNDADALAALYERMHGFSFGEPDPDLGGGRVATGADGSLVSIRKPLAPHDEPITRIYFAVDDIRQAVKQAQDAGVTVSYPPTPQGQRGTFAILYHGGVQFGLWQR